MTVSVSTIKYENGDVLLTEDVIGITWCGRKLYIFYADKKSCVHPGYRLRAIGICPIPCADPLPNSPLRASVKIALFVARICFQTTFARIRFRNVPCAHSFSEYKWFPTSDFFGFYDFLNNSRNQILEISVLFCQDT